LNHAEGAQRKPDIIGVKPLKRSTEMVVAEGPNEYVLYMQNDHGDLSGQFAAHWGNEAFAPL
jgi:hypothetical protein